MSVNANWQGQGLPQERWPLADQAAWHALFLIGNIFDGMGTAVAWRHQTRNTNAKHYGHWLGWLSFAGQLDTDVQPWDRVNDDNVRQFLKTEMERVASVTVYARLRGLASVMLKMRPDIDWQWLKDLTNRIKSWSTPSRDHRERILPADQIYSGVLTQLSHLSNNSPYTPRLRLAYRDALMMGLAVACPVRLKNFAQIRVGHELKRLNGGWTLAFVGANIKNGTDFKFHAPAKLAPYISRYMESIRPGVPGAAYHTGLWAGSKGAPLSEISIYGRMMIASKNLFGVAINPHSFRPIAATFLAETSVEDVYHASRLLGHRDLRTTEDHYIRASQLTASRKVNRLLGDLAPDLPAK
ncbi:MAG: site-specific integrase [Candidatus Poribacteria bacterium]|nr:site-specific integrase [Candidatus Poribacteria bacterium]